MERDDLVKTEEEPTEDFNSHAHVERDTNPLREMLGYNISTHTLTWSVTKVDRIFRGSLLAFQLTRSRGA